MSPVNVGVVGATGAVGRTILSILAEREFPVKEIRLFASSRSAGSTVSTPWGTVTIEDLATADPSGVDIALFSAGGRQGFVDACVCRKDPAPEKEL